VIVAITADRLRKVFRIIAQAHYCINALSQKLNTCNKAGRLGFEEAIWSGTAKRADLETLDALCRVLKATPGDLLVRDAEGPPKEIRHGTPKLKQQGKA
jgi:DNA-binding Xre family transcriptional regulator